MWGVKHVHVHRNTQYSLTAISYLCSSSTSLYQNSVSLYKLHPAVPSSSSSIAMPTPSVSPTTFTTTEEKITGTQEPGTKGGVSRLGIALGVTFVGLVVIIVALVVIFVLLKQRHRRTKTIEVVNTTAVYEEVPNIALSPNIHVEVNERGRIRRRTMDTQEFETPRARAVRSYHI